MSTFRRLASLLLLCAPSIFDNDAPSRPSFAQAAFQSVLHLHARRQHPSQSSRCFLPPETNRNDDVASCSPSSQLTSVGCFGGHHHHNRRRRRRRRRHPLSIAGRNKSASTSTTLRAFPRKRVGDDGYDNYDDDDDDDNDDDDDDFDEDDEPPSISTSPQEFLYQMQQREQREKRQRENQQRNGRSNENGDEPLTTPVARGRSSPRTRPTMAFNSKPKNQSNNNNSKNENKKASGNTVFACSNCGAEYVQWRGRCATCMEWNTIEERPSARKRPSFSVGGRGGVGGGSASGGGERGGGGGGGGFRNKNGSSWLDGLPSSSSNSFGGDSGPARLTDVYRDILGEDDDGSSSWEEAYEKGSRERRTPVPGDPEVNAVLGGGIMPGSICLVGGDPGVGKSTLLLQMAGSVASMAERSLQFQGIGMGPPKPTTSNAEFEDEGSNPTKQAEKQRQQQQNGGPVIYISGEENADQIASRALRLGIRDPELLLWCETDADVIADRVASSAYATPQPSFFDEDDSSTGAAPPTNSKPPSLVIVDSIQTMLCDAAGSSAAGGITQVRECVGLFLRLAKSTGVPIMLVGHVTKNGDVAGPRTVEHMVDCVLYLEGGGLSGGGGGAAGGGEGVGGGEGGGVSSLRILRAAKNRFGSSEEVGVYEMSRRGGRLLPVSDPSSRFLSSRLDGVDAEGCAISAVLEGMRSMTVEVQALVAWSAGSGGYGGRRIVDGISNSRLLMILAVLHKRYGISFHRRDVYVNVAGGMQLGKGSRSGGGGSDLAVAVAAVSSLVGIPVRADTAFVGEVGLLGELRPVHSLDKRIGEARRMGFSRIVTPSSSTRKKNKSRAGGNDAPGPKKVSAGGIQQLMCDNVLDAINCGLVDRLPTKQTRSGPKLMKSKRSRRNNAGGAAKPLGMDELDIILDDDDDDIYE